MAYVPKHSKKMAERERRAAVRQNIAAIVLCVFLFLALWVYPWVFG